MKIHEMTRISFMAALTFISGFIVIPVGPVPITLQTMFVLLSGFILTPKGAFYAQLINVVLMFLFKGSALFLSPSFGFLLSFLLVAPLLSWLHRSKNIQNYVVLSIVATFLIYLIGTPYMIFIVKVVMEAPLSAWELFVTGVLYFIPGDVIKAAIAVVTVKSLQYRLRLQQSKDHFNSK